MQKEGQVKLLVGQNQSWRSVVFRVGRATG